MKTIEEALKLLESESEFNIDIDAIIIDAYNQLISESRPSVSIEDIVDTIDRWGALDGVDYWQEALGLDVRNNTPNADNDFKAACNYVRDFSYHAGKDKLGPIDYEQDINNPVTETYDDKELDNMVGKVYNIQKIDNIFRRKKYGDTKLFAHTVCTKCGREKTVFLSNLVSDPDKYGSCICSDTNIEAKIDNIDALYSGRKKLASNTSGYTGVSFVKTYKGEPYNKWRAYIEVDGTRTYLGDFTSKAKAIKARKEAGEKGIKWYKDNRNKLLRDIRRKSKKYKTSKYRETQKRRSYAKAK